MTVDIIIYLILILPKMGNIRRHAKLYHLTPGPRIQPHSAYTQGDSDILTLLKASYIFVGCQVRHSIYALWVTSLQHLTDHLLELQRWFPYDASRQIGHLWGYLELENVYQTDFYFTLPILVSPMDFKGFFSPPEFDALHI